MSERYGACGNEGAPSFVEQKQLDELNIACTAKEEDQPRAHHGATAKPTGSRRTSADSFAVKMEQTKAGGRVVKSCSPFSAAKWQRQKSRRSGVQRGDVFVPAKKYCSALTVWIVGTDIKQELFLEGNVVCFK